MKIILVATDARGKNLVFVSDALQAYTLQEAIQLAKDKKLEGIYPVYRDSGAYLRTNLDVPKKEHLERLSISAYQLFSSADDIKNTLLKQGFNEYWQLYQDSIEKSKPFIAIDGYPRIAKEAAKEKLQANRKIIFEAAEKFTVDPYLLGAIIIDEIARFAPIDTITDPLGGYFIGVNTSVGIAQVKIDTARGLIKNGYYNPNPRDNQLSSVNIQKVSRSHLYEYVKEPRHSIFFAAAKMRSVIDAWQKSIDISSSPEIIATLYSLKGKPPHSHPKPNDRGLEIANEFYQLAKEWLR